MFLDRAFSPLIEHKNFPHCSWFWFKFFSLFDAGGAGGAGGVGGAGGAGGAGGRCFLLPMF